MSFLADWLATWRDYNIDGVPSSGAHDPVKADIRALGTGIDDIFATLEADDALVVVRPYIGLPPPNDFGKDGEVAFDPVARALCGPKVGGAWPATVVSLIGPTGPSAYAGTSTATIAIPVGVSSVSPSTVVVPTQTGLAWTIGDRVRVKVAGAGGVANWFAGEVTAYSGGNLTISADRSAGSGSFSSWTISPTGDLGDAGAGGGSITETPAYTASGGQGDRRAFVAITASAGLVGTGAIANLIDGSTAANTTNGILFTAGKTDGRIVLDFGLLARRVIQEITLAQSAAVSHGSWQAKISNDLVNFTSIGSAFTWNSTSQVVSASSNTLGMRYLVLDQVSGATAGGTYITEITVKIGRDILDGALGLLLGSTSIAVNPSALDRSRKIANTGFVHDIAEYNIEGLRRRKDYTDMLNRVAERRTAARFHADSVGGSGSFDGHDFAFSVQTITQLLTAITTDATYGLYIGAFTSDANCDSYITTNNLRKVRGTWFNNVSTGARRWWTGTPTSPAWADVPDAMRAIPPRTARLALRAGSTFKDATIYALTGLLQVTGVGHGLPPYLDCAPPFAKGSMTLAAGQTKTYTGTITREQYIAGTNPTNAMAMGYPNTPFFQAWQADAIAAANRFDPTGTFRRLARQTSIANVEANPGSIYFVTPNAASSVFYVHPYGDQDPTQVGSDAIKISQLRGGIAGCDADGVEPNVNKLWDHSDFEGLMAGGGVDGHGSFVGGDDVVFRRIGAFDAGYHGMITKSGDHEDCLVCGWDSAIQGIPFTNYKNGGTDRVSMRWRGMYAIQPYGVPADNTTSAYYCHSSNGAYYRQLDIDRMVCVGTTSGSVGQVLKRYLNDFLALPGYGSTVGMAGSILSTNSTLPYDNIQRPIVYGPTANPSPVMCMRAGQTVTGSGNPIGFGAVTNVQIVQHGVFHQTADTSSFGASVYFIAEQCAFTMENNISVKVGTGGGVFTLGSSWTNSVTSVVTAINYGATSTFKFNIHVIDAPLSSNHQLRNMDHAKIPGANIDYNVYVNVNDNLLAISAQNPTQFISFTTDAQFQAAKTTYAANLLGSDAHSVVVSKADADKLFLNGLAGMRAGDYRLNPECTLTFTDGQRIVDLAGPRFHLDWNSKTVQPGPPSYIPKPPGTKNSATQNFYECARFLQAPALWDYKSGTSFLD